MSVLRLRFPIFSDFGFEFNTDFQFFYGFDFEFNTDIQFFSVSVLNLISVSNFFWFRF